jgi:glycine/serine hydroxymethyltransferase
MKEEDMVQIARWIGRVRDNIDNEEELGKIAGEVKQYLGRF